MSAVELKAALLSVGSPGSDPMIVILHYSYLPIHIGVLWRLKIPDNYSNSNLAISFRSMYQNDIRLEPCLSWSSHN
jgi:hypothetical protein